MSSPKLADALCKAQGEFLPVPKNKTAVVKTKAGGEYRYKYADLADVLKMALPILSKHGIAFTQPLRLVDGKLRVTTKLLHISGEFEQSDGIAISELNCAQDFGSDMSYWRRYDGCSMLGVAPDEDMDGAITSDARKGRTTTTEVKPQSAPRETVAPEKPELITPTSVNSGEWENEKKEKIPYLAVGWYNGDYECSATCWKKGLFQAVKDSLNRKSEFRFEEKPKKGGGVKINIVDVLSIDGVAYKDGRVFELGA